MEEALASEGWGYLQKSLQYSAYESNEDAYPAFVNRVEALIHLTNRSEMATELIPNPG